MKNEASTVTFESEDLPDVSYSWAAAIVLIAFFMVLFFALSGISLFVS